MTYKPKFTITNSITTSLAKIERSRGFFDAINLSEELLATMQNQALLLEAHHTTHIEGTELTLDQSRQILSGKKVTEANRDDVQEIKNYCSAFELVSEYLNKDNPITESLIREIHKRLVSNVRGNAAAPGEYRKIQNYVINSQTNKIIYTPPPAYEVNIQMQELLDWINQETEISDILVAGISQFQLVNIHPFLDGNGRSARLLSTLCLYRQGYDFKKLFTLSEYYDRNRKNYYEAIQNVRNNNMDMTGWLEYFVKGLETQIGELQNKSAAIVKYESLVQNNKLSKHQNIAIGYIIENGWINIQNYEDLCPDVNKRTLQRELKELIEKNILHVEGATNNRLYKLKLGNL